MNGTVVFEPQTLFRVRLRVIVVLLLGLLPLARAEYIGSVTGTGPASVQAVAFEILGNGGGSGAFTYKGGGNAVDAAVASMLAACVITPGACSLGGYGGHMLIYKSGFDGDPPLVTCIDFNSPAGSLASSNMWVGSVNLANGKWTNGVNLHQLGWKAVGVPGTLAGLYTAQTNYGRKLNGTNYFPFAEILKTTMTRIANGQVSGNAYYTLSSVSNLVFELYTNSNPYGAFYTGDIAQDIAAAMQANGGLVTYADMTNYRAREVAPYARHFSPLNGTPATVYVAPPGSSGLSVLQEIAMLEAIGWTNGPNGTWDSLKYWHSRGEIARLMWKDHFQWIGDPWAGVLPPDILGNGSTNFCDQLLAHATNGYAFSPPWDTNEIRLTNSLAGTVIQSVNNQTNADIIVHWDDIRYGTYHLSTSDKWGNCVSVTWSMGGGFGAQVAVTNRGLVLGQGMALFDARPGWPDSIAPGKRPVNNMSPAIVVPDLPGHPTNAFSGGRAPFAVGGGGGSTIENNVAMQVIKYLTEPKLNPAASDPTVWLYNFEANKTIHMRPSYPAGVQSYLTAAGYSAPGGPPTAGVTTFVEGWIPPTIVTQPVSTNIAFGGMVQLTVTATGLPLFYQWYRNGLPLTEGALISGVNTRLLTMFSQFNSATYAVVITNGAASVTSAVAVVTIAGKPVIVTQPESRTNLAGSFATFSVSAAGSTLAFQWQKNGGNLSNDGSISGTETSALNVYPVGFADAGDYSVVVSNSSGTVTSALASLTVVTSLPPQLSLLWDVSPSDGQPWMNLSGSTSIPNQRSIAYNALSNHLYVISRSSSTTSNYVIHVLNATNGTLLYTLKTNGIQCNVGKGGIGLVGIGVADDGAIYACNEAPDAAGNAGADPTSLFRVYRWVNAHSNTTPILIFSGDPTGGTAAMRWGDNLTVRGSGTNTQILLDMTYFGATAGTNGYVAILTPVNQFLTNFSARWFTTTNFSTGVGRSLEFDFTNNAVWQKEAGKGFFKTTFNPAVSLGGTRIASSNVLAATNFSVALMGMGMDLPRDLAAGVFSNSTTSADSLNLYDVSDVHAPGLLAQYDFPTNPRAANGNRISQTFFKNDLIFTIDANNGIMVLRIIPPVAGIIELTAFARLPGGAFQFAYSNASAQSFTVFASTNLVNWNAIGAATQTSPGWFQFTDSGATNFSHRYYQLRSP